MAKVVRGVIPYDPKEGRAYVNSVGSNEREARVNVECLDISDEVLNRLEFLDCSVAFSWPRRDNPTQQP